MNTSRFTQLTTVVLGAAVLCANAAADEIEFDFKDPKGINSVSFVLDSLLEPIMGIAMGIGGKVTFDPSNPKGFSGRITIDTKSVKCSVPGMTKALHGDDWLNVEKYPLIEFVFKNVREVTKVDETTTDMTVVGDLKCKGVTKELVVPVSVTFLPGRMEHRMRRAKGDLLVLRSTFSIDRRDFGIKPNMGSEVVAQDIELRISIVGGAPKQEKSSPGR